MSASDVDDREASEPLEPTGLSPARPGRLLAVLGVVMGIGPLTVDLYLPGLPQLRDDLMATEAQAQSTLTGIMLGLMAGQLFIGPWSDRVGRRRMLLAGILVHALTSVLCAFAPTIGFLFVARLLQGLAGASLVVLTMAMVSDLFKGRRAARALSHLMAIMGGAAMVAPSIGSLLIDLTGWRGIFLVLALFTLGAAGLAWTLPETRPRSATRAGSAQRMSQVLRLLSGDRTFVALTAVAGLMGATMMAYVAPSSFVLQESYGLSAVAYGAVFGANAFGFVLFTQLNSLLLSRFSPARLLMVSTSACAVAGAGLVVGAAVSDSVLAVVVPLFLVMSFLGMAFPNAPAMALSRHREVAGTASALIGTCQFGAQAAIAPITGLANTGTAVPMGITVAAVAGLGSLLALTVGLRPRVATEPA